MAASPRELVNLLSEISFLKPNEYAAILKKQQASIVSPLNIGPLPQHIAGDKDQAADISREEIQVYLDKLTDIAIQSRADGNLIWGRIQGTKYEREASDYTEQLLKDFGFSDVRKDTVPARRPLWFLDKLEFTVTSAPGFAKDAKQTFANALTAYQSATTPPGR